MKHFLSIFCAMLLSCVSLLIAQNPTRELTLTGTLINPTTTVDDYTIVLRQTGKDNRVLEQIKPDQDGFFMVTIFSDRAVRLEVLDKKKEVVYRRTFCLSESKQKLQLKEIDLSKEKKKGIADSY